MPAIETFATRPKPVVVDVYAYMNEVANQAAVLLNVEDEVLQDMFNRQLEWWNGHARSLQARIPMATGLKKAEYEERFARALVAIKLLRARQHILVCPKHGVEGTSLGEWVRLVTGAEPVDVDAFIGENRAGLLPLYQAMANRGIFDIPEETGDWTTWQRDCEACQKDTIKAAAARRMG
jgi:hypothetical protein